MEEVIDGLIESNLLFVVCDYMDCQLFTIKVLNTG